MPVTTEQIESVEQVKKSKAISSEDQRPYFVVPLQNENFVGESITLKCIVMGTPTPFVEWKVNEQSYRFAISCKPLLLNEMFQRREHDL